MHIHVFIKSLSKFQSKLDFVSACQLIKCELKPYQFFYRTTVCKQVISPFLKQAIFFYPETYQNSICRFVIKINVIFVQINIGFRSTCINVYFGF